jgi:hypothetical protein
VRAHKSLQDYFLLVIQAEIDKTYQHCFRNEKGETLRGKIPDFLIHLPNEKKNLAVIEFKLASNLSNLISDFIKLATFKLSGDLQYVFGIEVIIGDPNEIAHVKDLIKKLVTKKGVDLDIIYYDIQTGESSNMIIKFEP